MESNNSSFLIPSEESSTVSELNFKESQNGESYFKDFQSAKESNDSFLDSQENYDQVSKLTSKKGQSYRNLLSKHQSSKIDEYSFKTPFSNDLSHTDSKQEDTDENRGKGLFSFKHWNKGDDEQNLPEEAKSFDLFIESDNPDSNTSDDPKQPLLEEDGADHREVVESKKDIWTNAILNEMEMEGSERSLASFQIHLVNISVPRNHLKLNIILRIILLMIYISDVAFLPWLRNESCIDHVDFDGKYWNHNPAWLYYK